jgi:hypothetical protein
MRPSKRPSCATVFGEGYPVLFANAPTLPTS